MNMNGADASAAAGFNTTKPNWNYTGPAFPQAEAQELLADGNNGPDDIHMARDRVRGAARPSAEEIGAEQYVRRPARRSPRYDHAGRGRGRRATSPCRRATTR